jgi:sugar phosphate isomerase/epimerase
LSNAERLNYFLGITHLANGYCFDVGHAHLYAVKNGTTIQNEFELMKTRIRSTHVHDNDGVKDNHRFPFLHEDGKIDWAPVMQAFRSRPGQFPLNLELREHEEIPRPFEGVGQVFERLESVA